MASIADLPYDITIGVFFGWAQIKILGSLILLSELC